MGTFEKKKKVYATPPINVNEDQFENNFKKAKILFSNSYAPFI